MSKIFEALRKTEGDLAEVAKAIFADQASPQTAARTGAENEPKAPEIVAGEQSQIRLENIDLAPESPMLPFDGSDRQAAEQYRIIRTKIHNHPSKPRVVLISSAMPGDGKTISAINLAAALSLQENLRVLLLDSDFRRSSAMQFLGLQATSGLGEVLRQEASLESSLIRLAQFPNMYLLPPGDGSPGPAELLSTTHWRSLLQVLRSEFRFMIIDAPPVGAVAEYELLQLACDGIVLVARQDYTSRRLWQRTLDAVPRQKQLGVILNCAEPWFLWKTNSYYYYSAGGKQ